MNTGIKKGGSYLGENKEYFVPSEKLEMISKLKSNKFVVFDLETTALKPDINFGKIIEIGAVKIEDGIVIDRYSTFVNPGMKIPKKIVELTHITDEMVKDSPDIWTVVRDFNRFIDGDYVLVAHNARFDVNFLSYWLNKIGEFYKSDAYICTMQLDKIIAPDAENHKLCTAISRYGIVNNAAHRAVDDAEATAELLLKMREELLPALEKVNYTFSNEAKKIDINEIKVRSYSDWKKPADKRHGELDRLYINLYYPQDQVYGSVYFDRILNDWFNKDFPETYIIDFEKLEELIRNLRKGEL